MASHHSSPTSSRSSSIDDSHELHPFLKPMEEEVKDLNVDIQSGPPDEHIAVHRHEVLDDPELEGLNLYEKKAALVNRELDSHGMGKYQWYIFFLCGFGYLIDLLYAQAFGKELPMVFSFRTTLTRHYRPSRAGDPAGIWIWRYFSLSWQYPVLALWLTR